MIDVQEQEVVDRGFRVAYMTPELFDLYWPQMEIVLDLEPELWNKVFTKEIIKSRIHDKQIQAWVVFNGEMIRLVFFTQRYVAPNGLATLQIFWMYGTGLKEVMHLLDETMNKFAATAECQRLRITGRKGFERLLAPLGAEYQYSVFSRSVKTIVEH